MVFLVEDLMKVNFLELILDSLKIYHTVTSKSNKAEIRLLLPSQTSLFDIVYSVEKNKWISARDKSLEISKAGGTAFFSNLIIHNSYFILQKLIPTKKHI